VTLPSDSDGHYDALRHRFTELWRRCLLPGAGSDAGQVWHSLARLYTEPHRHYHDMSHLARCLAEFDSVVDRLAAPDQVEMAVWFHDVIHTPSTTDNEAQSVFYFERAADGNLRSDFVAAVGELIMVTTHREAPVASDKKFICDIDMSSFGTTWDQFLQDSINLRLEYPGSAEDFYSGKHRFLEAVLGRPRIFLTDYFHDCYEQSARENIKRALALIEDRGTIETA